MATIHPLRSQQKPDDEFPTATELQQSITEKTQELVDFAISYGKQETTFDVFERSLRDLIFELARIVVALFLASAEERLESPARVGRGAEGAALRRTNRRATRRAAKRKENSGVVSGRNRGASAWASTWRNGRR